MIVPAKLLGHYCRVGYHATGLAVQFGFVIPAGDPNAEVKGVANIMQDTALTSLTPHVRAKDMTHTAVYPDATSEVLLRVPKYDFNWQITYELATPKRLPKRGSVVDAPSGAQ